MTAYDTSQFATARSLFPHAGKIVYLNSASVGPMPSTVKDIIEQNLQLRVAAEKDDWHEAMTLADQLRFDYADLIGAEERQIGIGLHTSHGLNVAAFGLPLSEGDEVMVSDIEFPATVYAMRAACESRGLTLRRLPSSNRQFDIDAFEKAITDRTRLLAVSWVQFFNGYKNDLKRLSEICRAHDIYFVVDGIQGMGAEPIDVPSLNIDLFTSGCQKWMLSPQGCSFFYISDRIKDRLKLPFFSWLGVDWKMNFTDLFHHDRPFFDTARRFEFGYGVTLNLFGMSAAVKIFSELGISNIQRHNHSLLDRLADYLRGNPFYEITSSMDSNRRSSILTFTCKDHFKLHRQLVDSKIMLVSRERSIRVSAHLYNDESDIDRLIEQLELFAAQA